MSIFTNIILFTYASEQIDALIPSLKQYTHDSTYSVLAAFSIEHILIGVAVMLRVIFDREPNWVNIFFARRTLRKHEKKYAKITTQKLGTAILGKKSGLLSQITK